jgi:hypothetical protein
MRARSKLAISASALVAIGAAFYFEPWTLFTSSSIDESVPIGQVIEEQIEETPTQGNSPTTLVEQEPEPAIEYPLTLAQGDLISHEHETSGQVYILELEDGSKVLRLENLNTSDGPQLEVWITDAPVIEGVDGWFVFDDGKYESLGDLKATEGNQNYQLPDDIELADFSSVSIWCSRFAVSFGAAQL